MGGSDWSTQELPSHTKGYVYFPHPSNDVSAATGPSLPQEDKAVLWKLPPVFISPKVVYIILEKEKSGEVLKSHSTCSWARDSSQIDFPE